MECRNNVNVEVCFTYILGTFPDFFFKYQAESTTDRKTAICLWFKNGYDSIDWVNWMENRSLLVNLGVVKHLNDVDVDVMRMYHSGCNSP